VLLGGFLGQEQASGFNHDVSADFVPLQGSRIALGGQANLLAVHNQGVAFDGNFALELAVHGIVLEHVSEVVRLEQVIDTHDFDVVEVLDCCAEYHTADTTEAVNTDFDCHFLLLLRDETKQLRQPRATT